MGQFSYRSYEHAERGWRIVELNYSSHDATKQSSISFSPDLGCNLLCLQVGNRHYLCDTGEFRGHKNIPLGTPILYPTPNRVRDAQFRFEGQTFAFEPNNGPHFLHGLVREIPWLCDEPVISKESISASARISFEPGTEIYQLFPIRNTLKVTYTLRPNRLHIDFCVQNNSEDKRLPFGLAIHPYFHIIGPRESVRLLSPAKKWMEATDLLPSGRLLNLEDGPADLRTPTSLKSLDLDDVFWGLETEKPQVIYYDHIQKKITLSASSLFTHSVIYTPLAQPFFCVENQSCSTDAHNLYAQGLSEAAHLTILGPHESIEAWIEIAVSDQ